MGVVADKHAYYLERALTLAKLAEQHQEIPVGALIVKDDKVLAEGYNLSITCHDPTQHAEIVAIRAAAKKLNNYRLTGTTLYTTLEPCSMCAGAIVHARIAQLVFATRDPKSGAVLSQTQLFQKPWVNHKPDVIEGIYAEEAKSLLQDFFAKRR